MRKTILCTATVDLLNADKKIVYTNITCKEVITQYGSTVYIGIAMVYPHWKSYISILTFNLKLISRYQREECVKNNHETKIGWSVM